MTFDHYILSKKRAPDWCCMFMLTETKKNILWPKCPVCYSLFWRCSWFIWGILADKGYQPMLHTDNSTMSTSFAWLANSFFPGFYSLKQNNRIRTTCRPASKLTHINYYYYYSFLFLYSSRTIGQLTDTTKYRSDMSYLPNLNSILL